MKKKTILLLLVSLPLLFMRVPTARAGVCGSYYANQPDGERCIGLDYQIITPSEQCVSNGLVCCSSQAECPGAFTPTPTLPANSGYEESNESCGTLFPDRGLGREVCLNNNKILSNAQSCPRYPECCREPGNCTRYWTCTDAFACVEDPNGGFSSNDACLLSCVTPFPTDIPEPTPDNTFEPIVNRRFLFRVNPLTVEDDPDPARAEEKGMWKILRFANPARAINTALVYLFPLAGMILFIMIVWGGFEMMRGAADTKAQEAGKNRITAALIGFGLLFISYWIAQIVQFIFGVNILG